MLRHLAVLAAFAACCLAQSPAPHTPRPAGDLETVLSHKPHYSMLLGLLRSSGLLDTLKQAPALTLFAPTNAALSAIPNDQFNDLKNDASKLAHLLKYHATNVAFHTGRNTNDRVLNSMDGNKPIRINVYKTLHVQSAEGVNITENDIRISNGFVQGIDGVMSPPEGDAIDVINADPNLTTLAALIHQAGLEAAIRADKNITVFAPTNAAFAQLTDEALTYLQNSPQALQEVLLYHVVKKTTLYSIGMRNAMTFETADKHRDQLMLIENQDGDEFYLNNAKVSAADISATNGVVHQLDGVLVPPTC